MMPHAYTDEERPGTMDTASARRRLQRNRDINPFDFKNGPRVVDPVSEGEDTLILCASSRSVIRDDSRSVIQPRRPHYPPSRRQLQMPVRRASIRRAGIVEPTPVPPRPRVPKLATAESRVRTRNRIAAASCDRAGLLRAAARGRSFGAPPTRGSAACCRVRPPDLVSQIPVRSV